MKSNGKKLIGLATLIFSAVFALGLWLAPAFARAEGECVIKEARFRQGNSTNMPLDSWYSDDSRPPVRVDIHSENCADKIIEISITDSDDHDSIDDFSTRDDIDGMNNEKILVPGDYFSIKLVAGEDECEMSDEPDCNYYIRINKTAGGAPEGYVSWGKERGILRYDCTGIAWLFGQACDELWSFSGIELLDENQWVTLLNDPNLGGPISGYVLLAPLPGLESIDTTQTEGGSGLADYLNKIFAVAIGAAGLLAVLMLVISGMQYMMTDSIFQKSEAKNSMGNALLGLFLALGAFVILNTINPDLINIDLRVDKISINIDDMPMVVGAPGTPLGNYKVGDPWPPTGTTPSEADARKKLSDAGITVTSSTGAICTTVGQKGCTSVGGLPISVLDKIIKIKELCACTLTVTGGTEYWHHNTHGLGKPIVDFSVTEGLTELITGQKKFPNNCLDHKTKIGDAGFNITAKAEGSSCPWEPKPAPHWHIVFD